MSTHSPTHRHKQAFRALNHDGLLEILAGLTFFVCSAFVANASLIVLLFIPVFLLAPGLRWLRQRFVYPRIGYARIAEDVPAERGAGILFFSLIVFAIYVLALVGFGVASDVAYWRRWAPALAAALCSGGFLFLASRSGLARHYVFVGASLVGGLVFSLLRFERPYENVQLFLLGLAALLLVSGGCLFWQFLRRHPAREEEGLE